MNLKKNLLWKTRGVYLKLWKSIEYFNWYTWTIYQKPEYSKEGYQRIYQIGSFKFRQNYLIKIFGNTHSIGSETETIELLNFKDLEYLQKRYKILHIGAVQVAAKLLTRLGLDKPIYVYLRDAKHNNFQDLLLGVMESNMTHGLVYFDYYLDLELICIDDLSIHKALTLNIQTKGYDMNLR